MRKQEILDLKWSQIDLGNGFMNLPDMKSGESAKIPINDTIRNVMVNIPRRLDIDNVFFDVTVGKLFWCFNKALERAGIANFRFHDLRHTFASHLAMQDVSIVSLKRIDEAC